MQTIRITTSQNIDIDYELAGLGERIVATMIDYGLFLLITVMAVIIGSAAHWFASTGLLTWIIIGLYAALFVFYDLICEIAMNGQSVGKKVMKIKVISLDGGQASVGQYLLRWLFRIVDFTMTSDLCALVCVAVSDKKQRLGDMVAGTTLIKTTPRTQINHVAFMPEADGYEPVFANAAQLSDQDIELVHEVINSYIKTRNSVVVFNMAQRIKEHLAVAPPPDMNDMQFLQTIVKDYNFIVAQEAAW